MGRRIGPGASGRSGPTRLALVLLCLLSLTWQGYLTQTHIHTVQNRTVAGPGQAGGDKRPANDLAHCFICHEMAATGSYLLSAPAVLPTPRALVVFVTASVDTAFLIQAVSHRWRSRGPPLF